MAEKEERIDSNGVVLGRFARKGRDEAGSVGGAREG